MCTRLLEKMLTFFAVLTIRVRGSTAVVSHLTLVKNLESSVAQRCSAVFVVVIVGGGGGSDGGSGGGVGVVSHKLLSNI